MRARAVPRLELTDQVSKDIESRVLVWFELYIHVGEVLNFGIDDLLMCIVVQGHNEVKFK